MLNIGQWAKWAAALSGVVLASGLSTVGCGTSTGDPAEDQGEGDSGAGADDGLGLSGSSSSSMGSGSGENCAEFEAEAESRALPADIVLAIDQSGSMNEETDWVEQQLNTFAAQITSAAVDVQVTVIAGKSGGNSVCVPAPLGSGACPDDDNPPALLRVDERVGSNDALELILLTYDQWQPTMRAESAKHFVVISDDNAEDVLAADFIAGLATLDAAMFGDFTFHAIVADDGNCDPAAAEGTEYKQLVQDTGGILGDLCLQNFQPVWDELSAQVVDGSTLACNWAIPEPPDGQDFDPQKVNVDIRTDGSGPTPLGYVEDAAACASVGGGWHYDDPTAPSEIVLCPATCDLVQTASDAGVSIKFGCATEIAK